MPVTCEIATIRAMLDFADIRLLTPEEQAARAAEVREQEELEHQRLLDRLDQWERKCERGGRPPIVLPSEIARRVLADIDAGYSDREIVRKYEGTPWRFSCRWLADAKKDGRLHRMAQSAEIVRENLPKKAPVFTAI